MTTQSDSKKTKVVGSIRCNKHLISLLEVCFTFLFTQLRNHHLYSLALCGPFVRVGGLRTNVKRDPAVGVSQELLIRSSHILHLPSALATGRIWRFMKVVRPEGLLARMVSLAKT